METLELSYRFLSCYVSRCACQRLQYHYPRNGVSDIICAHIQEYLLMHWLRGGALSSRLAMAVMWHGGIDGPFRRVGGGSVWTSLVVSLAWCCVVLRVLHTTHFIHANDVCDILLNYYNTSCKVQTLYYNATILHFNRRRLYYRLGRLQSVRVSALKWYDLSWQARGFTYAVSLN